MNTFLVTGPTGFLGYHVVKLLNSRGARPRVLLPADTDPDSPALIALKKLDIEVSQGSTAEPDALRAACEGVGTVLHLDFTISPGGGDAVEKSLHEGNVVATRNLLEAAAQAGVKRVVVSSSSLAVGLHRDPQPLDENADWERFAFSLPYALSRRRAEQEAIDRFPSGPPEVVAVNPSFTLGPDDWIGAPANKLVMRMAKPGFRISAPIGFGILDVRDYADGVLRAAEHGTPGRRYLLSGANVMLDQLAKEVAEIVGIKPPSRFITIRAWMVYPIVAVWMLWSILTRKPIKVSPKLLELWGRYAWYDTRRARDELGWEPRPQRESLRDSIAWMKEHQRK